MTAGWDLYSAVGSMDNSSVESGTLDKSELSESTLESEDSLRAAAFLTEIGITFSKEDEGLIDALVVFSWGFGFGFFDAALRVDSTFHSIHRARRLTA